MFYRDEVNEARLRVAGLVEEVLSHHGKRSKLYSSYDDAINKFKHSKDSSGKWEFGMTGERDDWPPMTSAYEMSATLFTG